MATQFCPACGKENDIKAKFCKFCGEKMPEVTEEELKAEETKAEETKAEETKVEETKTEETKAEETKAEEAKTEETKAEETKAEETKTEETKSEESTPEERDIAQEVLDYAAGDDTALVPAPAATPEINQAVMSPAELKAQKKAEAKAAKEAKKQAKLEAKGEKKGNAGVAVLIILLILVLCGGLFAYLFFFTNIFSTPKQRVAKAFVNTFGTNNIIAELSGIDESANAKYMTFNDIEAKYDELIRGPFSLDFEMTLDKLDLEYQSSDLSMAYGAGIFAHSDVDMANRNLYVNFGGMYNGTKLLDFDVFFDDSDVSFATSDFFTGYLTFNSDKLGSDILSSPLYNDVAADADPEVLDTLNNIKFNIFDLYEEAMANDFTPLKENHEYVAPVVALYDDITVEKTGEYAVFEIADKDVKCNSYTVTLTKDALITFYQDMGPFFSQLFDAYATEYGLDLDENLYYNGDQYSDVDDMIEDMIDDTTDAIDDYFPDEIAFTVYLNEKKGNLVAIAYNDTWEIEDVDIEFDFYGEFLGEHAPTDQMYVDLYMGNADDTDEYVEFILENDGDSDGEQTEGTLTAQFLVSPSDELSCDFDYSYNLESGDYEISGEIKMNDSDGKVKLESEGTLVADDSSIDLKYDSLTVTAGDSYEENSITFSGIYTIAVLEDDVPTPSGTKYEIFKMTQDDFMELMQEVSQKAMTSALYEFISDYIY